MTIETDKPKTKPKRKYKKRKTKLSYGPRGLETLRLCYQVGGLTALQHSRFFNVNIRNSYRLLSSLAEQRLLESAPVQTTGRPRDFHYLSKANASRAIAIASYEAGLYKIQAKEHYRFHGLPQNVEHAHARNEFYLALLEASREGGSSGEVKLWGLWGESLGSTKRAKVYPDGLFEVHYGDGLSCRYLLEYESRSRPGEVLRKLDAYGAYFHRLLKESPEEIKDWLRPMIFLFPRRSTALHVSNTVSGAARANAKELQRLIGWFQAASRKGINAGRLVLFASLEDLEEDALGVRYRALMKYPEDVPGTSKDRLKVELEAVAEEFDEVLKGDEEGQSS